MLAALLAAAIWLMVASTRGWPVSTTHSIVGAVVGFAIAAIGNEAVNWVKNQPDRGKLGSISAPRRGIILCPDAQHPQVDLEHRQPLCRRKALGTGLRFPWLVLSSRS